MAFGDPIDASGTYKSAAFAALNQDNRPRSGNTGYWANGGSDFATWPGPDQPYRGYMGLSFLDLASNLHYAWIDVGVAAYNPNDLSSYEATVYGYGYESDANVGILAGATGNVPEPASLALLALGAAGFIGRKKLAA
ncbi:MAG: PEP-CTERM sorting domain-containing protein [Methylococcaceae bacterium]|nr:PEP-CTERM sorting domain-containing protein [Methylococcaceae bacterium]